MNNFSRLLQLIFIYFCLVFSRLFFYCLYISFFYHCQDGSYRYLEWRSKPYQNRVYGAANTLETERERAQLIIALQRSNDILSIISKAQSQFIAAENGLVIFEELLSDLLNLRDSQYGFIGIDMI